MFITFLPALTLQIKQYNLYVWDPYLKKGVRGVRPAGNFQLEVVPLLIMGKVDPAILSPDPWLMVSLTEPCILLRSIYETNQDLYELTSNLD